MAKTSIKIKCKRKQSLKCVNIQGVKGVDDHILFIKYLNFAEFVLEN